MMNRDNVFPPKQFNPSHVTGVKELIEEGTKFRAEIEKRSRKMFQENCAMCDRLRARVEQLEGVIKEIISNASFEQMNCAKCGNAEPMADCDYVLFLEEVLNQKVGRGMNSKVKPCSKLGKDWYEVDKDYFDQLRAEVERLKTIETKYEDHLQQLDCPECGEGLTEVQPGKHQCDWCELTRENERLQGEVEMLAMTLWRTHYQKSSPEFELCDSVIGIISQIDNMVAGIIELKNVNIAKVKRLQTEVDRLNCNSVECNHQRDILETIYEAMAILPCNGVQGILCGAAQEIQALRNEVERLESEFPVLFQLKEYNDIKKAIAARCAEDSRSV